MTILVTGSEGLIGRHLESLLQSLKAPVRSFDLARSPLEDVRSDTAIRTALHEVRGVVHLAAVSRVKWAEDDPEKCRQTNVNATKSLLRECLNLKRRPWVIFCSSREVYGNPEFLPVSEDALLKPLNVYAVCKVEGENACREARENGLLVNICRFSNVYGCAADHPDRVVPAFARAAVNGGTIRVEGANSTFDFTHVDEVVVGLNRFIEATMQGEALPPIHFVSGQGTTLGQLAELAKRASTRSIAIIETRPRDYDVSMFIGDPARARHFLGWEARISVEVGFRGLVEAMADRVYKR
jgi:nucleoside-diphosphate-sugar epimerase